ncbi:hypothetical protein ACFYKX_10730 [Cytobacillus sp. FJAT-54145]|uniref:Uncharacterized protein n=1 Tax=Cytobacillus spartinae TaxID=3299023 RepID=A0ABW6KA24_9BACI
MNVTSSKEKIDTIARKRQQILETFFTHNWKPNRAYCSRIDSVTGEFEGEFYLISPCKEFAVTIKKRVIHVHECRRQFAKVLNLEILTAVISDDGIANGLIQLKWQ